MARTRKRASFIKPQGSYCDETSIAACGRGDGARRSRVRLAASSAPWQKRPSGRRAKTQKGALWRDADLSVNLLPMERTEGFPSASSLDKNPYKVARTTFYCVFRICPNSAWDCGGILDYMQPMPLAPSVGFHLTEKRPRRAGPCTRSGNGESVELSTRNPMRTGHVLTRGLVCPSARTSPRLRNAPWHTLPVRWVRKD